MLKGYNLKRIQQTGAVVIDRDLRERLGWSEGQNLTYLIEGKSLRIYPPDPKKPAGAIRRYGKNVLYIPRAILELLKWSGGDVVYLDTNDRELVLRRVDMEDVLATVKEEEIANG